MARHVWECPALILVLALAACSGKSGSSQVATSSGEATGDNSAKPAGPPSGAFIQAPDPILARFPSLPPEEQLITSVIEFNSHIFITDPAMKPIEDKHLKTIQSVAVPIGLQRFAIVEMQARTKGAGVNVTVKGVLEGWPQTLTIAKHVIKGNAELHWDEAMPQAPAIIGDELALHLGVKLGDTFRIETDNAASSVSGAATKGHKLRVVGLFHSGFSEYNERAVLTNFDWLKKYGGSEVLDGLELRLADRDNAAAISRKLRKAMKGSYVIQSWCRLNRMLFEFTCLPPVRPSAPKGGSNQACNEQDAEACYVVGQNFESRAEHHRAQTNYTKACSLGLAEGCAGAGRYLLVGRAGEVNYSEAYALSRKGCELGSMDACYMLGWQTAFGMEMAGQAHILWEYACNQGHGRSCGVLGREQFYDEELESAMISISKGCEVDDAFSCKLLGELGPSQQLQERYTKALGLYDSQCTNGFVLACSDYDELKAQISELGANPEPMSP